ncbi:hypothetical protein Pelo_14867 [Pelomyxa schiedti]|nr:hypothetical protein Pelo_14867 [Pelomyxa schiedti]
MIAGLFVVTTSLALLLEIHGGNSFVVTNHSVKSLEVGAPLLLDTFGSKVNATLCTQGKQRDTLLDHPCSSIKCEYTFSPGVVSNHTVLTTSNYYLYIINCAYAGTLDEVIISYTFLNPGEEQLPVGGLDFSPISLIFLKIFLFHTYITLRDLHPLLTATLGACLFFVVAQATYWTLLHKTGHERKYYFLCSGFLIAVMQTTLFSIILLVCKGFRIIRQQLQTTELRTIIIGVALLFTSLLFHTFYNDGYYFLTLLLAFFFILPRVTSGVNQNMHTLHAYLWLLHEVVEDTVLRSKMKLLRAIRAAVILYFGAAVVIICVRTFIVWNYLWLVHAVAQVMLISMIISFVYWMTPKRLGPLSPMPIDTAILGQINLAQFHDWESLIPADAVPDLLPGTKIANFTNFEENLRSGDVLVLRMPSRCKHAPLTIAIKSTEPPVGVDPPNQL